MKLLLTCPRGHRQEILFVRGTDRKWADMMAELLSTSTTACKGKGHSTKDEYCGKPFKARVVK